MEMQLRINEYWSKRSDEFADARYQDLHSQKKEEWLSVIRSWLPDKKEIRALDLGTGAGFFAFLMQELGCTVTGIDYSEAMIDNAKKVMGKLGREGIVFRQMDAQKLDFEAESFDFIFSRNVTWTLPDPEQAYREMYRVLAPGGCILNLMQITDRHLRSRIWKALQKNRRFRIPLDMKIRQEALQCSKSGIKSQRSLAFAMKSVHFGTFRYWLLLE